MKKQTTKIIKVDEETHRAIKTKATLANTSMKDFIKNLFSENKPLKKE